MKFYSYNGNNTFIIQNADTTMEISKKEAFELFQLMTEKLMPIADSEADHEEYWPED
jgi:hypothetical protein